MDNKLVNFVRYNNAIPIAVSLVVFATAGVFAASPEIREDVANGVVSSNKTVLSVDNTRLLAAELDKFDFKLKINGINEDGENYYVDYSFDTFVIEDYIWQTKPNTGSLKVIKTALAGRDLGNYVAEELKELVDYERMFLADTQNIEKQNGVTQKMVATTYSGLIGKYLDPRQEVFTGYEEVVKDPKPVLADSQDQASGAPQTVSLLTEDYIRELVQNMISQNAANNINPVSDIQIGNGPSHDNSGQGADDNDTAGAGDVETGDNGAGTPPLSDVPGTVNASSTSETVVDDASEAVPAEVTIVPQEVIAEPVISEAAVNPQDSNIFDAVSEAVIPEVPAVP